MHHILYHDTCADGFLSYVLLRHLLETTGKIDPRTIHRHPCQYARPWPISPSDLSPEDNVFIVDFSAPARTPEQKETLLQLREAAGGNLVVLDHHATVPEDWRQLPFFIFDNTLSGAGLVWREFGAKEQPLPELARLIQWRDLGHAFQQANEPDSHTAHALHAALMRLLPRQYRAWLEVLIHPDRLDQLISAGIPLRQRDHSIIQAAAQYPTWIRIAGHTVPAVDGLGPGLISDACQHLLERYPAAPFAASWFLDTSKGAQSDSGLTVSLRSRRNGVNVGDIAATLGGGGHANAAGFTHLAPLEFVPAPQ